MPRRAAVVAWVSLGLYGAWLWLWRLDRADWLPDEVLYAQAGRAYLSGEGVPNAEHPPLAKLLFGLGQSVLDGRWGPRLPAALLGLATAVVLALWVHRAAGRGAALAVAGLWVVLPHVVPGDKLDRFAMLDVVAAAAATGALAVGWCWAQVGGRRLAVAAGVLVGAAAAAKLPGGLVGPVVVGLGLVLRPRRTTVVEAALMAVTSAAALVAAYLPLGAAGLRALDVPVRYQLQHAADGHTVLVAGRLYDAAPWWTHAWYAVRDDGWPLVLALGGLGLAALLDRRHRALVLYAGAAVVVPAAVLATSPVALPHYRYLWLPAQLLLCGVGLVALLRRGWAGRAVAGVLLVPVVVASVQHAVAVAGRETGPYARAACAVQDATTVLVRGYPAVLAADLGDDVLVETELAAEPDAVLLDPRVVRRFPRPDVTALLDRGGYVPLTAGELVLHVRPQAAAAAAACGLEPAVTSTTMGS